LVKIKTGNRASTILYNFILSNDINKGTWIIPTNVCHYVPATILKTGSKIEILDVSKKDLCLDNSQVLSRLEKDINKYAGIIYVRSFGLDHNVNDFFMKIRELSNDIILIDDKCLSIPSIDDKINSLVDLELYSTGYSKYIDLGQGGFAKLNNKHKYSEFKLEYSELDEKKFSEYFRNVIYNNDKIDNDKIDNDELSEMIKLNWLDSKDINNKESYFSIIKKALPNTNKNKSSLNEIYDQSLIESIKFNESSNVWRYNLLVNNREEILKTLKENNLFASKHYFSLSKIFEATETPVWNSFNDKVLNLFNDFRYTKDQAQKTINIINEIESR
jgi:dTDP-4-amino-4,6-dideoxygalactose transaminase